MNNNLVLGAALEPFFFCETCFEIWTSCLEPVLDPPRLGSGDPWSSEQQTLPGYIFSMRSLVIRHSIRVPLVYLKTLVAVHCGGRAAETYSAAE